MLENILNSCNFVVEHANHIKINYDTIDSFINTMNCHDLKHWLSNNPYHIFDLDIATIINFLLFFESINYSFWGTPKWTIDTEFGKKDGTDALLYIMIQYVKENKKIDFTHVSFNEFQSIMKGNIEIPLLEERYKTLVEVSNIVNTKMNSNFYQYIYDITDDRNLFDIIIKNFPSFKDERKYHGRTVYFYKLAQLLTSDILHLREIIEGINVDYSHLIGCADYKIPQTMRALNMIEYSDELASIIDSKKEIDNSSEYEVEIRASMLIVIHYIKNKIVDSKAIDINDYFFTMSKKVKEISKPYHLCRNKNY